MKDEAGNASLLHGAQNFRAVKPYPAAGGKSLRANTIFRSGELSRLTETDLATISSLNIRMICDLRTGREQTEFPSNWPSQPAPVRLDLPNRDESDAGPHKFFELMAMQPGAASGVKAMDRLYRNKPRAFMGSLRILFETILAGGALPLLVHCHAGKDRTGFVIAMLLAAAGVSKADIIDDYVTTSIFFPVERESVALAGWAKRSFNRDIDPRSAIPMVEAREAYIEAAFEEIDKGWGGTEGYLRTAVGLSSEARETLQALLLE